MIDLYFEYARDAICETIERHDPLFVPSSNKRKKSVLWVKRLPTGRMPYRFVHLTCFPGREEFGVDIGWSTDRTIPLTDYYSVLLEHGLRPDDRCVPCEPCQVPLISHLVLGSARDWFSEPNIEAIPPSIDRLASAIKDCFDSPTSLERLRDFCDVAGLGDRFEAARTIEGARLLAPKLFNVFGAPLSTDWQIVQYLTGVHAVDVNDALAGPCAIACVLLEEFAMPLLQSENLTPVV